MLPKRRLGDLEVSAIGMGAMSLTYTPTSDVRRGVRTVHAALAAGITLFDTADVYGPTNGYGVNETALISALRSWPGPLDDVVVATKAGHTRHEGDTWWIDGSREHLRAACVASIRRLGLDPLPLYQHHRPDPRRPYAESMHALKELHDEGLIRRVGVSNVTGDQLGTALAILGDALVSVQNEHSPVVPADDRVVAMCERHGLALLAYGPLGGMRGAKEFGARAQAFARVAEGRGVSAQQVALAWALSCSPALIPIPGASRPESVVDSAGAAYLSLDDAELALLDAAVGPR